MKRLLCILSGMNVGGAETYLMKLYRNLDRSRYQMDFCINNYEKQFYEDEIVGLGGKIFRIPCKSDNFQAFKKKLFDVIKENQYKYVLRVTSNAMGFIDLKIAKDAGAIVRAVRTSSAGGDLSIKAKVSHLSGRLFYGRYVNKMIAPSDLAAVHTFGTRAYQSGKVHMLRNALDLNIFKFDKKSRAIIRVKYNIPAEAKVIGSVGQLRAEKNHKFLIDVFSKLCASNLNAYLLLVGSGDCEQALRQQVAELKLSDKVIFAGMQKNIPPYLSAMDLFVLPSFYEGMPNAVIEAQAVGLPCIVSDTITREADISGMVQYLSLDNGCNFWANILLHAFHLNRSDKKDAFIKHGYEIKAATKEFEKLIFGS